MCKAVIAGSPSSDVNGAHGGAAGTRGRAGCTHPWRARLAETVVTDMAPGNDATPDFVIRGMFLRSRGVPLATSAARHRVFTLRAERATSTLSSGVYRWAANESFGDPFPPPHLERS